MMTQILILQHQNRFIRIHVTMQINIVRKMKCIVNNTDIGS